MSDPYASKTPGKGLTKVPLATQEAQKTLQQVVAPPLQTGPRLSPESIAGLDALAEAMEAQKEKEEAKVEVEEKTDKGKIALDELPENYQSVLYQNTPWDNKKVRRAIESRCSELSFEDLILRGRVRQTVPISKKKLEVEFQSVNSADSLWITQNSSKLMDPFEAQVWAGYARMSMSLVRVNDKVFPDHLVDGKVEYDAFNKKHDQVMALNDRVIQMLLVNMSWFEDRISRLFVDDFDLLKNG